MPVLSDVVVIPRLVTWELFVKGFNDQYCPATYRMDHKNAFLYLKQGQSSVSEYESKFTALSRFTAQLIPTDADRCQRFRYGLNSSVTTRLTVFIERDYVDLADMARRIGKDVNIMN